MAEQNSEATGSSEGSRLKLSSLPILTLVNTLAILAAIGLGVYTKLIYKRPLILEEAERAKLAEQHESDVDVVAPASVKFGPITSNIASTPDHPNLSESDSKQMEGKLHYVTLSFSLEIHDESQQELIETIRPQFLDRLNQVLGKKHFSELSTVQGRYLLQAQIIDMANRLAAAATPNAEAKEGLVTNLYFTQFIVQ